MSKPTILRSLLPLLLLVLCALTSTLAHIDVHTTSLSKYHPEHKAPPSGWSASPGTVAFSLFEVESYYGYEVTGFVTFTQESKDTAIITGQFNTGFDRSSDPSDYSFLLFWHSKHYIWLDLDFEIQNGGTSPFQYHADHLSVEELIGGLFFIFYKDDIISVEYIEK
ncbi:hypothetical protein BC937DRAFT_91531, partial [Endogone sp. FLAS-F59071]